MKDYLVGHLDVVFFFYGLAFVVAGIAIVVQRRATSRLAIAKAIPYLAFFALIHGANEWMDMWVMIRGKSPAMDVIRWMLLTSSFVFLFEFGRRMVVLARPGARWLRPYVTVAVTGLTLLLMAVFDDAITVWPRYFLGLPAAVLSAAGFALHVRGDAQTLRRAGVRPHFYVNAVALASYAIFSGAIVSKTRYFPASFLNTDRFLDTVGIPVQVFRALSAAVIAWATVTVLRVFDWEDQEGLRREIRQRTRAEVEAIQQRESLSVTLHSVADALVATDREGRVELFNPWAARWTGCSEADALGHDLREVCAIHADEDEASPLLDLVGETLRQKRPVDLPATAALFPAVGRNIRVSGRVAPIKDGYGVVNGSVLVFRDITEPLALENQMARMRRLESIGELAGGIAHDFDGSLAVILGNASLLWEEIPETDARIELVSDIERAVVTARRIAQQLLTFASGGTLTKSAVPIEPILREAAVAATRASRVRCRIRVPKSLRPVYGDPVQLRQVIESLVLNAVQAMPNGGIVSLGAEHMDTTEDTPFLRGNSTYVRINVTDTGIGIPEAHMDRIFEPYFTTKPNCSGLGLATSYTIVTRHKGQISARSTVGGGSTFFVILPVATESDDTDVRTPEDSKASLRSRKILVLEPDPEARALARRMLRRLGFAPDVADDGPDAVRMFQESAANGGPYEAVLLSISGDAGGKEALEELVALEPHLHALVSCDGGEEATALPPALGMLSEIVPRPFTLETLRDALDRVLGASSHGRLAAP